MLFADVAELADALDLGSSVPDVKVQVLSSAPRVVTKVITLFVLYVEKTAIFVSLSFYVKLFINIFVCLLQAVPQG